MVSSLILGLLTGMGFGIVLYKVGASRYSRVIGMLTVRDTKVMKFAFSAVATASMLYGLASVFGVAEEWHLVPRVMPFMGAAHLVGGILFGVTMGLVGFCPGTCMAKVGGASGEKKFAGLFSILGLFTGILVYGAVKGPLTDVGLIPAVQKPLTIHGLLGISYGALALIFGVVFWVLALVLERITPERVYRPARETGGVVGRIRGEWSWWASGALAGLLVVLATAQNGYLGFSGALLAAVGWGADLVGRPLDLVPVINNDIVWRASLILGVLPGGLFAKVFSIPSYAAANTKVRKRFELAALVKSFAGGVGLSLGAMIGGGCTTGAFIAAWPTLSVGSFAMGATFFASSMLVSNLMYFTRKLDLQHAQLIGDQVYD